MKVFSLNLGTLLFSVSSFAYAEVPNDIIIDTDSQFVEVSGSSCSGSHRPWLSRYRNIETPDAMVGDDVLYGEINYCQSGKLGFDLSALNVLEDKEYSLSYIWNKVDLFNGVKSYYNLQFEVTYDGGLIDTFSVNQQSEISGRYNLLNKYKNPSYVEVSYERNANHLNYFMVYGKPFFDALKLTEVKPESDLQRYIKLTNLLDPSTVKKQIRWNGNPNLCNLTVTEKSGEVFNNACPLNYSSDQSYVLYLGSGQYQIKYDSEMLDNNYNVQLSVGAIESTSEVNYSYKVADVKSESIIISCKNQQPRALYAGCDGNITITGRVANEASLIDELEVLDSRLNEVLANSL